MRSIGFGVFAMLFAAYAAFAIPAMLRFYKYCELVASATGRSRENHSLKAVDDGGFNAFQLEQWRALRSGTYRQLQDEQLISEGHAISKRIRLMYVLGLALIAFLATVDLTTK